MSDEPQTLQDLARLASERHDGKRGRALGRIAAKHGLTLTYTTFDNIYSGKYMSTPKRETVDALAVLASVPKEIAYRVAGLPLPQAPFADQLPPDVDTLDADQRRVLIEMARVLVKQNRQIHDLERAGDGSERSATSMKRAGGKPAKASDYDLAAYEVGNMTEQQRLDKEASELGEEPQ
ncbi:hypothetical protein [Brevibacterium oceani]|uniref:hypothetical protein n=1 Tax=Brevibacterium oceani TaxID=358099 RepID=UPI0015E79A18|nr:hypothetical protein [Brevibacterium oceani]